MKSNFFKTRFAAIILIAAGYGWAGGHYITVYHTMAAYISQCIIVTAFLILGIRSLTISENEQHKSRWPVSVFSIFSVLLLLINIMNSIHRGHILGLHNSFANLVPVAFLITGNILWVTSIVLSIKHDTKANLFKNQYNIL